MQLQSDRQFCCSKPHRSHTMMSGSARLSHWLHATCSSVDYRHLLLTFLISLLFTTNDAYPSSKHRESRSPEKSKQVTGVDYLAQFGYLPQSDRETGALRSEAELVKAIRAFQKMAHLPPTGELDDVTVAKMQAPRCGLQDKPELESTPQGYRMRRYVHGPSKWDKTRLTYKIRNYTPDLETAKIRDSIEKAFQMWSEVTPLVFTETYNGDDADMYIIFASGYHGDGYRFDGPGLILAHAFFPGEDKGGDVHFDEDELWTWGTNEGTNLFTVAAHEIGHAIGLSHSNVAGSLMYPWYQGYTPDFKLTIDDIAGIQALYGGRGVTRTPVVRPTEAPKPTEAPRTQTPVRPTLADGHPDPCNTNIDAISIIRLEIFAFKDNWFWRIDKETQDAQSFMIREFWYGFPADLSRVDAVYERPGDGNIVFFSGSRYWLFNGNQRIPDFPEAGRPIHELGFPSDVKKVDAAFVWGYNSRTYFITGDMYWRFNEVDKKMDHDYPRDLSMWKGVQKPIDDAFQYYDKTTYFFSGMKYWKFNDARMQVHTRDYPQPVGRAIGCKTATLGNEDTRDGQTSNAMYSPINFTLVLITVLLWLVNH